jgi:hypothetical protein
LNSPTRGAFLGGALALAAARGALAASNGALFPIVARRGQIARLTVFHLGRLVTTYRALAPEALETFAGVTVTHERGLAIDAALRHLEATTIGAPEPSGIDARWGLVFERADGSRVGSVYLDRFGHKIAVRAQTYDLVDAAGLFAWLRSRYGPDGVIR